MQDKLHEIRVFENLRFVTRSQGSWPFQQVTMR